MEGEIPISICKDDGVGLLSEEKEKIFELRFGKNTGLGLILSREILQLPGSPLTRPGNRGKGHGSR
jgi:signal transduction histidine kinase